MLRASKEKMATFIGTKFTFPLMVSSTTTKITKTMKFSYHIYVGTSREIK